MIREFFNKLKQRYRELNEFLAKYPILDWEELYFIQEYEAAKEKIKSARIEISENNGKISDV